MCIKQVEHSLPAAEEMVTLAPAMKRETGATLDMLPFYEDFGYSIKSLATSVMKSPAAMQLRQRWGRMDERGDERMVGWMDRWVNVLMCTCELGFTFI